MPDQKPFTPFTSRLVPLPIDNVDTDQIIPARFLKTISKEGLGDQLFNDWRYEADGTPKPEFILNRPQGQGRDAQILLAGDNFGCGSSREHAPWALTQYGFRAIISTSFADIFNQNAFKNSLLPIEVPVKVHKELFEKVNLDPGYEVGVDLAAQVLILPGGKTVSFPVDPFAKICMLNGVDQLGYILKFEDAIKTFELQRWNPLNTLAPVL